MTSDLVAKTIMQQIDAEFIYELSHNIGTTRVSFFRLVGASDFVYDDNSLMFFATSAKYPHRAKIVIKLNEMDTYDIGFWTIRSHEPLLVKQESDVYADELTNVLRKELGI